MLSDLLWIYPKDCFQARFIQRVKRFSIEVAYGNQSLWIHSNNSGSMLGLTRKNQLILVSKAKNPKRKLPFTEEAVFFKPSDFDPGFWVGVNTAVPLHILGQAHSLGLLDFLHNYPSMQREKKYGESRLDALFLGESEAKLYVECKNVTLMEDDCAMFPDAKSERAQKHLETLINIVSHGYSAAMFYLVQRPDGHCFGPCAAIDCDYARLFYQAISLGVKIYPYRADISLDGIRLGERLPLAPKQAIIGSS
ncbi:MAG: DNA/RNA nuclease SfsA [Desulfovibrionaceae bacterium]|nr:DNA/RNA nuclease SfsA [Desulfovibrionaceae bacterium]